MWCVIMLGMRTTPPRSPGLSPIPPSYGTPVKRVVQTTKSNNPLPAAFRAEFAKLLREQGKGHGVTYTIKEGDDSIRFNNLKLAGTVDEAKLEDIILQTLESITKKHTKHVLRVEFFKSRERSLPFYSFAMNDIRNPFARKVKHGLHS
jgi:hypothetical protein